MFIERKMLGLVAAAMLTTIGSAAVAQQASPETAPAAEAADAEQEGLKIYFDTGSAAIRPDQREMLDTAARTFREGNPFVMILSGGADTVGNPATNLSLSLQRASAVAEALSGRGIPVGRLQVLGRGVSELEVTTGDGISQQENRVVEITWR